MSQVATTDTPTIIDDKTPNYHLPLPSPQNLMSADCLRIRQALMGLDTALASLQNDKLDKSGGELTGALFQKSLSSLDNNAAEANYITKDINDNIRSIYRSTFDNTGLSTTSCEARSIKEDNTTAATAVIRAYALRDGTTYAIAPPPRNNNYGSDIVTMKTMRDNTLYYLPGDAQVHINPLTGSDTADLFMGRGLSTDKPFKSFDAAMNWLLRCSGDNVLVMLDENATWSNTIGSVNIGMITISSHNSTDIKTLTVNNSIALVRRGCVRFQYLKMQSNNNTHIVRAEGGYGTPIVYLGQHLELSGSVTGAAVIAGQAATVEVGYGLTGEVTGKRYQATAGSKILVSGGGTNFIPGTEAGTVDATSIYG